MERQKRHRTLKALIGSDEEAWEKVLNPNDLYASLSHASALSLAHNLMLGTESGLILGSEYDPAKEQTYNYDLRRCATAAEALAHLIGVVTEARVREVVNSREHR